MVIIKIQQSLRGVHQQLQQQLIQCRNDLKQIAALDRQIKSYSASAGNPLVAN